MMAWIWINYIRQKTQKGNGTVIIEAKSKSIWAVEESSLALEEVGVLRGEWGLSFGAWEWTGPA